MPARQLHLRSMTPCNTGTPRRSIANALSVLFSTSLYLAIPGVGQAEPAAAHRSIETSQHYSIPAGPLAPALRQLASNSNVLLTFTDAQTAGKTTAGIAGQYTLAAALSALLTGTGMQAVQVSGGGYVLRAAPEVGVSTLPEVAVKASREPEEKPTGPVRGYVAKRSATGTKTDTPIIETPQSITVIGQEEMQTLGVQSLQDALSYAAGVSRAEGLDRTTDSFFLRGFRTNVGSTYRDGSLYTVNIYNGRQETYGLERIELLKGAASVLYGSAGPGGIINTVSKRPTVEPLRELSVQLGSFDRKQVAGDFGGALDKDGEWSYRLTFLKRDSNTFVDYVPDDRVYIAPALKWQPSTDTSLTLLSEYQEDKTSYVYGLPGAGTVNANPNGRIKRSLFPGEPGYDKFNVKRYSVGYLFEHAFSDQLKLRNNVRYYHARNEYNSADIWQLLNDQRTTRFRGAQDREDASSAITADTSLQYQFAHGSVQHTALVGVDIATLRHQDKRYNRDGVSLDLYSPVYGGVLSDAVPASNSAVTKTRRQGVYVQDQIKIAEKWVVLLGGRYDTVNQDGKALFTGEKWADDEKSYAFTGRAGLVYLADNGLAPFVSYSESFEPTTGTDRTGSRFKPTEGKQIEAGVRYQPSGSDMLLSAAVYQLTRENVTVIDPADTNFLIQTGKARSRGLELEARTRVGRHANIIATYAYTDARTTQASPLQPEQEGQRLDSVPFNQLSLWGDYSFGAFALPDLKIGAGLRYVDETRGMGHGTAVSVPAFTLLDAMASYTTGAWRLALNITNLTDKTYIASCTYGCFYGEPRKAVLSATYRW